MDQLFSMVVPVEILSRDSPKPVVIMQRLKTANYIFFDIILEQASSLNGIRVDQTRVRFRLYTLLPLLKRIHHSFANQHSNHPSLKLIAFDYFPS